MVRIGLMLVPGLIAWVLLGSTIVDDAHITWFVADRLAATGQVINYDGVALEQSSSLLHVLVLGVLHLATGMSLPTLAWLVGVAAAAALVWLTWDTVSRLPGGTTSAAAVAAAVVAVSAGVVQWSVSGMETTLAAVVVLLALRAWHNAARDDQPPLRGLWACAAGAALYFLVRPEGPLVLLAVTVGMAGIAGVRAVVADGVAARRAVAPVAAPIVRLLAGLVAGAGTVAAVRWALFGSALPQPAATKGGEAHLGRGLTYLRLRLGEDPGLALLLGVAALVTVLIVVRAARPARAAAGLAAAGDPAAGHATAGDPAGADRNGDRPYDLAADLAVVLALGVVAITGFAVLAGGDWMPGPRLLVPAIAPAAIVAVTAAWRRPAAVAVLVVAQVASLGLVVRADRVGTPTWYRPQLAATATAVGADSTPWALRTSRVGLRDLAITDALTGVVEAVAEGTGTVPMVASFQAGQLTSTMVTRFGGDVVFVDLARLTSRRFDSCGAITTESIFGQVVDLERWAAQDPPCGVDRLPEVYFGLGAAADNPLASEHYTTVVQTTGQLGPGGRWAGRPLSGRQFVAVRTDLAGLVAGPVTISLSP